MVFGWELVFLSTLSELSWAKLTFNMLSNCTEFVLLKMIQSPNYPFKEHFTADRRSQHIGIEQPTFQPTNKRPSCHPQSPSERERNKAISSLKHKSSFCTQQWQLVQRPLHWFMFTQCYLSINLLHNAKVTLLSIDHKSLFPLRWNMCWNWFRDWSFCYHSRG